MAGPLSPPSDTDTETSVHTEPSAGDAYRGAFEPYRVDGSNPLVSGFREWWLKNPLNNLWTKKPNLWRTYQAEQAGLSPQDAVKSGANIRLSDLVQRGPTLQEVLDEGEFELQPLPSDEAWFGEPDPAVYAAGTNDLTKEQLEQEVAKGNVCTLRQLKQHLLTASEDELEVWRKLFAAQEMKEEMFVDTPEGRVSVWDLLMYVRGNPELEALVERDLNLAVPVEGMTREERIAQLAELAPWRLCANERHMVLPPGAAAKLPWGMLAAGTWWHRRPARWLKGFGGQRDLYYGMYVHEAAAQQLMGDTWGGRSPQEVLADKAFYREALGLAPSLGMTLLAVASRPLPLDELTGSWEQRVKQQIDKLGATSSSSSNGPKVFMSTTHGGSSSSSGETGSSEEEASSSSSSEVVAAAAVAAAPAAASKAAPAVQKAAVAAAAAAAPAVTTAAAPAAPKQQQQQQVSPTPPRQQAQQQTSVQQLQQQQPPAQPQQPAAPVPQQQQQQQQQLAVRQQQPQAPLPPPPQQQQQQQVVAFKGSSSGAAADPTGDPQREVAPQYAGLSQLVRLFDQQRLAEDTELLDMRTGTKLREGAMIMLTAHPTGALMVQAVSPGLVKEQQSYLLGSVFDPQLTRALMSMFMDPDHTLDPEFTAAAGTTLLGFVNGFRHGQQQGSGVVVPGGSLEDGRKLLRQGKWRLPALGQAPEQETLLSGVQRAVVYKQIASAFDSAMRAAAAVQVPQDADPADAAVQRRMVWERRHAAEKELKRQLSKLGLDTSSLNLQGLAAGSQQQAPRDLLSLARPLA